MLRPTEGQQIHLFSLLSLGIFKLSDFIVMLNQRQKQFRICTLYQAFSLNRTAPGIKSKAAISLTFDLHCTAIAALFCLYSVSFLLLREAVIYSLTFDLCCTAIAVSFCSQSYLRRFSDIAHYNTTTEYHCTSLSIPIHLPMCSNVAVFSIMLYLHTIGTPHPHNLFLVDRQMCHADFRLTAQIKQAISKTFYQVIIDLQRLKKTDVRSKCTVKANIFMAHLFVLSVLNVSRIYTINTNTRMWVVCVYRYGCKLKIANLRTTELVPNLIGQA